MRWLFGIFLVVVALWCGYWFAGSSLIERQARDWFAAQSAQGWMAEHQGIDVAGFANRFDLTVTAPHLATPDGNYGWHAPAAKFYAMTWKPWHILAALPETQVITLPGQEITMKAQDLGASIRARPTLDLPLAEARLVGQNIDANSTLGWRIGAESLAMAIRAAASDAGAAGYDLGLEVKGVRPDASLFAALAALTLPDQPEALPGVIDRLHLDARLQLSAPLDRHLGQSNPRPTGLELRDLSLDWGAMKLRASGTITPDAQGFASGEIRLALTNWQHLPPLLVALGLMPERMAPTLTNMLRAVAKDDGDGSTVTMPLRMVEGWVNFGPLPLGPAPMLLPPQG